MCKDRGVGPAKVEIATVSGTVNSQGSRLACAIHAFASILGTKHSTDQILTIHE